MKMLKKKNLVALLVSLFVFFNLSSYTAKAESDNFLAIKGEAAILVDASSGRILYQENPDTPIAIASMTKMMTEYLLHEAIKEGKITWDQKTSISEYAYKVSQDTNLSNVPLKRDEQYSVRELYESMAIYSANGSTIALAELIAGSEGNFVKMMNEKAEEMGLKDYRFVNSTGLNNSDLFGYHVEGTDPNEENSMTARDCAILAYRLIKDYPEVLETSSIPQKWFREGVQNEATLMQNWNWMIPGTMYPVYDYEGVDGLKTGSTDLAGKAFTATAEKNGIRLISVVMKTNSYADRFGETKKLLDYGFSNYSIEEILPANSYIEGQQELPVVDGNKKTVNIVTSKPLKFAVKNGEKELYELSYTLKPELLKDGSLAAPLEEGQAVGRLEAKYKGDKDYGYLSDDIKNENLPEIVTANAVKRANIIVRIFRAIANFFTGLFK